jgi:DNA-directed RNA polymerase subunit M/transcription elongation factor TFIIS
LEASAIQEQQALQAQQLDVFRRTQTLHLLASPTAPHRDLLERLVPSLSLQDAWSRTCQATGSEEDEYAEIAVQVEFQLFRLAGQSRTGFTYRQVVQDFLFNWAQNGSHAVDKYGTDIETLTTLTAEQWAEGTVAERKRLLQAKRDADYQAVLDEKEEPVPGTKAFIPCPKCHSRDKKNPQITFETTWRAVQIRSCDEPATIFVKCINPRCGEQTRIG